MTESEARSPGLSFVARWIAFALIVLGGARLALLATSDLHRRTLVFAAPDDAFYYLQIAWNLSRGLGSTFDGIHPTNGYQPAWCLLLAAIARCVSSRAALLDASIGVAAALHLVAGVMLASTVPRAFVRCSAPLLLALWLLGPQLEDFLHLEAPLNSVALAALLACSLRAARRGETGWREAGSWLALGLAAMLASLTRLDNAVLLPAIVSWVFLRGEGQRRDRVERAAWVALPSGMALLVYAVLNWVYVGAPLPVSGTLKVGMQLHELRDLGRAGKLYELPMFVLATVKRAIVAGPARFTSAWFDREPWNGTWIAIAIPSALAVAGAAAAGRAGLARDSSARAWWRAVTVGVACHALFMLVMVGTFPREWHWMPEAVWLVVTASFAIPSLVDALASRLGGAVGFVRGAAATALTAGIAVVGWDSMFAACNGFAWGHLISNNQLRSAWHWNEVLPPGTRVGAWNAGYLAYFSDLQVVNLDGLVNAPDFARRVENDRWLEYCRETGIRYVEDVAGGAFDVLARQAPLVERWRFRTSVEYVLLRIPDAAS